MKNTKDIRNDTELGKLWQEEIMGLSEISPESLDSLEERIDNILHRLGKAMLEWKLVNPEYVRTSNPFHAIGQVFLIHNHQIT